MTKKLIIFLIAFAVGWMSTLLDLTLLFDFQTPRLEAVNTRSTPFPEQPSTLEAYSDTGTKSRFFWGASAAEDKYLFDYWKEFSTAVQSDDREAVASLLHYPLRVNFPTDPDSKGYTFIKNKQSFIRVYEKVFDKKFKRFIEQVDPENKEHIWAIGHGIAVGRGVIWIGEFCSETKCENDRGTIKIRTLHANSHIMDLN